MASHEAMPARHKPHHKLPAYEPLLENFHTAFCNELRAIMETLPVATGDQVLDVGCGDGAYTCWLAPLVGPRGQVTALDASAPYLALTRQAARRSGWASVITTRQGRIERLPFKAESFDVVWCAQSLYSFPDPQEALREMARVTRPRGIVAVLEEDSLHDVLLPWPAAAEMAFWHAEWQSFQADPQGADRFYVGRNLRELFMEVGLQPQRRKTHALHREFPLTRNERKYIDAYLANLRRRIQPHLAPAELKRWLPLLTPGHRAYLPAQKQFSMTCLNHTLWGKKQ